VKEIIEESNKLISYGINITPFSLKNGTDILNCACKNNDFEFVKYLVK
jgi:hypothetical protein